MGDCRSLSFLYILDVTLCTLYNLAGLLAWIRQNVVSIFNYSFLTVFCIIREHSKFISQPSLYNLRFREHYERIHR